MICMNIRYEELGVILLEKAVKYENIAARTAARDGQKKKLLAV